MEISHLKLWPEIITQKQLLGRAYAIISRDYCKEMLPELEPFILHMPSTPTLRNVIAQLIRIERSLLENCVLEDGELKSFIGLNSKEKRRIFEDFLNGYEDLGIKILMADLEIYRRKRGVSFDFVSDAIFQKSAEDLHWTATMIGREPKGLSLVDYLSSESVTAEAAQLASSKDLTQILDSGINANIASQVGEFYSLRRYRNLHNFLEDILPLPAEYEAK